MTQYLITDTLLNDLADAVSAKSGESTPLTIAEMTAAVGSISDAAVDTLTSTTLSSTTTTLVISGLEAKPKMWALQNVVSNGSYFSGASTRYITSCLCDGGSTVYSLCLYKSGSTAREYGYTTCTWSYSNGTITITSPGTGTAGGFRTGSTYRLFYAY